MRPTKEQAISICEEHGIMRPIAQTEVDQLPPELIEAHHIAHTTSNPDEMPRHIREQALKRIKQLERARQLATS